jgi:hypothetical protein
MVPELSIWLNEVQHLIPEQKRKSANQQETEEVESDLEKVFHITEYLLKKQFHNNTNELITEILDVFPEAETELVETYDVSSGILSDETLTIILHYLLYFSVTFEERKIFLDLIMNKLEESVKFYLRQKIQEVMEKLTPTNNETEEETEVLDGSIEEVVIMGGKSEEENAFVEENLQQEHFPSEEDEVVKASSSTNSKNNKSSSSSYCEDCSIYQERNKSLQTELQYTIKQYSEDIQQLKSSLTEEKNKLCDYDILVIQKNSEILQLTNQLSDLTLKYSSLQVIEKDYHLLKSQLMNCQEELLILQTEKKKFTNLELSYQRLKEKVEESNELRNQLKQESSSHQETFSKFIEIEKETEELRKLKPMIESYRKDLAEKTIEVNDLRYTLSLNEKKLKDLFTKMTSLEGYHSLIQNEKDDLLNELTVVNEELREKDRYHGIGEGISELNPMLLQELEKLKSENHEFKQLINDCDIKQLEKLQKENIDQITINQSLIGKWNHTKESLTFANHEIKELKEKVHRMENEYSLLMNRLHEISQMTEEERNMIKRNHKRKVDQLSNHYSEISLSQENQFNEIITNQQITYENEIKKRENSYQNQYNQQQTIIDQLSNELEEEKMKRRKVERVKKMIETESQRQKLQLSAMNTTTGNDGSLTQNHSISNFDYETAAKEIRQMQEKLDHSNQEILSLKSVLATSQQQNQQNAIKTSSSSSLDNTTSILKSKPQRMLSLSSSSSSSTVNNLHSGNGSGLSVNSYLDQVEVNDKRIEQLEREKREILSRSLEDNKEKMELSQKLLLLDKENASLKNNLRKITLEKERLERKMLNSEKAITVNEDRENQVNLIK